MFVIFQIAFKIFSPSFLDINYFGKFAYAVIPFVYIGRAVIEFIWIFFFFNKNLLQHSIVPGNLLGAGETGFTGKM